MMKNIYINMKGIYQYTDLETGDVIYVGKDSNIDKNSRHKAHLTPSQYDTQHINRVLQNNPKRYQYEIIYAGDFDDDLLNVLEINTITEEQPKFNFTVGGDGCTGFKHTEEAKRKISNIHKGKTFSEEHKQKISESRKGKTHSEETRQKISENNCRYWKDKTLSDKHKQKISESKNTSGYLYVTKKKTKKVKQGFIWAYQYYDEEGKRKYISSVDIKKLEEKVKSKGLIWKKLEER